MKLKNATVAQTQYAMRKILSMLEKNWSLVDEITWPTELYRKPVVESRNKREGKYVGHTTKFFKKVVKAKRGHSTVPDFYNHVCGESADCKG